MATRPRPGYTDEDGYRMPLRGNVETIRNLLAERYNRGFPVIKELLQNSDDAKSTKLRFGWTPGLEAGQGNPLFEGPGFIVINDGPFRPGDADNMRNFSSSMQATNASTIGSFGLGLKSLYHLGEAVLYFSSENGHDGWGDGRQGRRHGALSVWFHPDGDPALRPEWHVVVDAISSVKEHSRPLTDGLARWFCLWVPLRKEAHCVNGLALGDPPPGDPMPGEVRDRPASELMPDDAPEQLASILPMLATLREITYRVDDGRGNWDPRYEVTLLDGSRTVSSRGSRASADAPFKGVIAIRRWDARDGLHRSEPSYSELAYRGHEVFPADPRLRELADDPRWPRSVPMHIGGVDPDQNISERVEVDPHAAVYWAVLHDGRGPGSSDGRRFRGPVSGLDAGALTYSYAVYLPLGDPRVVGIAAPIKVWNVRHARFWVDSGRREPLLPNPQHGDDRNFKEEWNETLRLTGIEPWVIPTLNQMVELIAELHGSGNLAIAATHEVVEAITSSVSETAWYKLHRDDVCRSSRWISTLDPGSGRWEWRQVDGAQGRPLVSIPDPSSETLALAVVPGLRAIATDHAHVVADRRIRLTTKAEDQLATWTVELVKLALDSINADDVLGDLDRLRYLRDFVGHVSTCKAPELPGHPDIHAAYCRLLRRMLGSPLARTVLAPRSTEPPETHDRRSLLKDLVSKVPKEMRWSASISGASAGAVLGAITVGVMVPELLEPTDSAMSSAGKPDARDVKAACVALADLEGYVEDRGHPEEKILSKLSVDARNDVLRDLEDVRFIRVEELGEGRRDSAHVVSWLTLRTLYEHGRLVSANDAVPGRQQQFLWKLLADPVDTVLDGIRLASISADSIKTFFAGAKSQLDENKAVRIIREAPELGPPSDRVDGFRWLLTMWHNGGDPATLDENWLLALRYLLHGEPSARENTDKRLLLSRFVDTPGGDGWGIGWTLREGLAQIGQAWRVIGNPLASLVDDEAKERLNIADVSLKCILTEFYHPALPETTSQIANPLRAGPPAPGTSGVEPLVIRPSKISFEGWKAEARDLILQEFKPAVEGDAVPFYLKQLRIHDRAVHAANVHSPIEPSNPASYCNQDPSRDPAGVEALPCELIDAEQGHTYLSDPACPYDCDALAQECFVVRLSGRPNACFVQRKLFDRYDWQRRLEVALKASDPSRFHREIMDALAEVTGRQDQPLKGKIEETPWLPLTTGGSTRPADVMLVERDLAAHWQRILRSAGTSSRAKQAQFALDLEVQAHRFWDKLRSHFLQDKEVITRHICREAVANLPANYATGLPTGGPTGSDIVGVFGNRQEPVMGFASLLASLWPPLQDLAGEELGRAASQRDHQRLQAILGVVASVGETYNTVGDVSVTNENHKRFVRLHAAYLRQLGEAQSRRLFLETSSLLSATGTWLPASSLCLSASNPRVVPDQRAHEGYDKHLGDFDNPHNAFDNTRVQNTSGTGQQVDPNRAGSSSRTIGDPPDDPRHRHSADNLRDFARPLDAARVPRRLIGALVTLLGPGESVAGFARELLCSVDDPTDMRRRLAPDGDRVGKWRQFVVTVVAGTTNETFSIVGTPLTVNLVSEPNGHGFVARVTRRFHYAEIDLMMPQNQNDAGTLSRNVKDTADYLISQVYRDATRGQNFSTWWKHILFSGNEGVRVEKQVVAGSLASHLRQIGIGHLGPISEHMGAVQRAIDNVERVKLTPVTDVSREDLEFRTQSLTVAERQECATKRALLEHVDQATDTQELIRESARRFVGDRGYASSDVLFELYRNAHDALNDMDCTNAVHGGASARRIVIEWDDQSVRIAHWGREINEVPTHGSHQQTDRLPAEYESDINRMLTVSGPRGSASYRGSTEWHGLGFKSVHLVSDWPRIQSGTKSFKIHAVFIPVDLSEDESAEMVGVLERMTGGASTDRAGTLIDLPWRIGDDPLPDPIEVVTRFEALAEFLPLFSGKATSVEVGPSSNRRVIAWNERPLHTRLVGLGHGHGMDPAYSDGGGDGAEGHTDIVTIGASPSSTSAIRFLCIQSGDCRIVLAIGSNGFERVGAEVPTFWAVTPIGRITNLGLFLAGDFGVATGRKAIRSDSSRTEATIARIGGALGRFLTAIASLEGADFEDFLRATGMLPHLSRNDVWTSLVQSLCGSAADTTLGTAETANDLELVRKVLWGSSSSGFARVFADASLPVIPSMLPGAFSGCFRPAQVQWFCDGELCRHDDVLSGVLDLPGMTEIVPPGSLIEVTKTRGWLRFVSPSFIEGLKPLRIATLVKMVAERPGPISDGMASKLWECVSPFVSSNSASTETREVTAALGEIRFRTEEPGSTGTTSKGLMALEGLEAVIHQDEPKYARVLDTSQQLSREYGANAVRLFGACRPQGFDTSLVRLALGNLKGLPQVQATLDLFEPGATGMVPNLQDSDREVIRSRVLKTDGISPTDLHRLQQNIVRGAPSEVTETVAELPAGPREPDWERDVQVAIEAERWFLQTGWRLTPQYPVASAYYVYSMDFAVVDPSDGTVIAGIECDGHTYHSGRDKMVDDQSREFDIHGAGIRMIHRIWDVRWRANQRFELERLRLLLLGDDARIAL